MGYQQGIMKFTEFPDQWPGWWAISRESCKFTGFPELRQCWWAISRESCKLHDSLTRGQAGGLSARNHVNLQDTY